MIYGDASGNEYKRFTELMFELFEIGFDEKK